MSHKWSGNHLVVRDTGTVYVVMVVPLDHHLCPDHLCGDCTTQPLTSMRKAGYPEVSGADLGFSERGG